MDDLNHLLAGKNVLVAGVGPNIGQAIAFEMARQGANIYGVDRDEKCCAELERRVRACGVQAQSFVADLSREQEIIALTDRLQAEGIAIDVLVSTVGVSGHHNTFDEVPFETPWQRWHRIYDSNVIGPAYLAQLISQRMIENRTRGCLIFISSIHQWTIFKKMEYSSSKAALGMIVQEMAVSLAAHGIRVNGIAPGSVEARETGAALPQRHIPLGRTTIPPVYVGRAAVYLAAEYFSKHTTGSILKLDGGQSLLNFLTVEPAPPLSLWQRAARKIRHTFGAL